MKTKRALKPKAAPAPAAATTLRPLGPWPEQGGTNAGVCYSADGQSAYYLIVHETETTDVTWEQAKKFAAKLTAGAHRDFTLPEKHEGPILYAQAKALFASAWYWLGTPHASNAGYAWVQYFGDGGQYYNHKSDTGRARAVRRLTI